MYMASKQMYSYQYNGQTHHHPSSKNSDQNIKKMIENYSYGLSNQIGKGYSSKVYKGINEVNGETVAIKVIDKGLLKTPLHHALLQSEIEALSTLDSQYIMKLYKVFQTQNNTYLITEFCDGGDLGSKQSKQGKFSEAQASNILYGLVKAYKLLKQNGIIHRDIKPANVLLAQDGNPKLADFGFATTPNSPPLLPNVNVGSPLYMSPQALKNNKYSDKSDIWAIGATAFEIIYGQVPWQATSEKELAQKMLTVPVHFPSSVKVSQECKDFIKKCLIVNELDRANIDELERHPWIKCQELQMLQNISVKPQLLKTKTLEYKEGKENSERKSATQDQVNRLNKKHNTQVPKVYGDRINHSKQATKIFEDKEQQFKGTNINSNDVEYTLQAQINFCKYLHRVAQLIEQCERFSTSLLRDKLLFFVVKNIAMKIYRLKDLDQNYYDLLGFDEYKQTQFYKTLTQNIGGLYSKYQSYFKSIWMQLQGNKILLQQDKKFDAIFDENFTEFESFYIIFNSVLRSSIKELARELEKDLGKEDDCKLIPLDKEKDVVLLDYLVTYFQLSQLILETFNKPNEFATKSKIEHIADGSPYRLSYGHFTEIKHKIIDLDI